MASSKIQASVKPPGAMRRYDERAPHGDGEPSRAARAPERAAMFYQVGEVCHLAGLTPRALHYYDEIGLLVPTERLAGGHRLYTAGDLNRIERIKDLKRLLGLSLSEIKRILDAEDARRRYLEDARETADPASRRRAVEGALAVTEEQLRSVRDKVRQLGRLQRQLGQQVRALRRQLAEADAPRAAAGAGGRA